MLVIEADRLVVGGGPCTDRCSGRSGMAVSVVQHADIGGDHRIHPQVRRLIHRRRQRSQPDGCGKVLSATNTRRPLVWAYAPLHGGFGVKIQAGKMAGIGIVAEADVNRIGPMIDSGFSGEIPGRTDQFQRFGRSGCRGMGKRFPTNGNSLSEVSRRRPASR